MTEISLSRPPRDLALDSFRGTDVLLMILVNVQGKGDVAFPLLSHAEWTGLTLADLVFPIFLLISGLSLPMALDRTSAALSGPNPMVAIGRRAGLLFLIGVVLSFLIRPTLDPDMIRWTGVLQRIAIVYAICAGVILIRRGAAGSWTLPAALAVLLLLFHSWMLLHVGGPNMPPSMEPGQGISGWLDQNFIPGRVLRKTWEPEGILSTVSAIANGLIGVAAMRWMLRRPANGTLILAGVGALMILMGWAISPWLPINKNLWTASFALITSGTGLAIYAGLRSLWPIIGNRAIARWAVTLGQAALTLYIVHTLLIAIIVRKLPLGDPGGEKIWDISFAALASAGANIGISPALASLIYAVIAAAISCAILPLLVRRGWVLKL